MTNGKHIRNVQMIGNAGLMGLPKTAFLSSRKVAPQDVMRCYDWATGMRGGGRGATALPSGHAGRVTLTGGSAGRLAPPGDGGHAGRMTLPPDFAKCGGGRREVEAPLRWRRSIAVQIHGAALPGRLGGTPRPTGEAALLPLQTMA